MPRLHKRCRIVTVGSTTAGRCMILYSLRWRVIRHLHLTLYRLYAVFCVCVLAITQAYAKEPLSVKQPLSSKLVLVADDWCPYSCHEDDAHSGIIVDVVREVFEPHGVQIVYKNVPWTRAVSQTRKGVYDGVVGAAHADAPDFIFPRLRQANMRNTFYVLRDSSWRYEGINSLASLSIGVVMGYSYYEDLDDYIEAHKLDMRKVQPLSGDRALINNIRKLLAGRVGAVIEASAVMHYNLNKMNISEQVKSAGAVPVTDGDNLYVAFSPKHPQAKRYARLMDEGMRRLQASGRYDEILSQYGVKEEAYDSP